MSALLFFAAALFTAQEVDAQAAARIEGTAGQVPTPGAMLGTESEVQQILGVEINPSVAGLMTTHAVRMTLSYAPRIYYRTRGVDRPLLLNRATLIYQHAVLSDLGLLLSINGSKGDLDSIAAANTTELGTSTGDTINVTSLGGSAALTKTFGASETLSFDFRPDFTQPSTGTTTTQQLRIGGDVIYTKGFTAHDTIQLLAGSDFVHFEPETETGGMVVTSTLTTRAHARYTHVFNRHFTAHLLGGAAVVVDPIRVLPLVELGFEADLYRRAGYHFATGFAVGVDTFANPLLGTFDNRLTSSLTVTIELGSRLSILASGSFYTTISAPEPRVENQIANGNVTESVFQARLPLTYEIVPQVFVEVGGRTSMRGPRLTAEDFRLGQVELVGYVALQASIDTQIPAAVVPQ